MSIRKAVSEDVERVVEIAQVLYLEIPDFVWTTEKFIRKQIEKGEYYLSEENGKTTGVMSLRERNKMLYIETLAVAKDIQAPRLPASGGQAKGVGSRLIEFAKQFARENGFKILRTTSFYEYGVKDFYIKNGFQLLDEPGQYNGHKFHRLEFRPNL